MQDKDDTERERNHYAQPKVSKAAVTLTHVYYRLSSLERQVTTLKNEREKLIQISGDLKAQLLSHEKQLELNKHQQKLKDFKLAQAKEQL